MKLKLLLGLIVATACLMFTSSALAVVKPARPDVAAIVAQARAEALAAKQAKWAEKFQARMSALSGVAAADASASLTIEGGDLVYVVNGLDPGHLYDAVFKACVNPGDDLTCVWTGHSELPVRSSGSVTFTLDVATVTQYRPDATVVTACLLENGAPVTQEIAGTCASVSLL